MAHPTKEDAPKPAPMAPTRGVGPQPDTDRPLANMNRPSQNVLQTQDTAPAEPVLFADIEPGLLGRCYPNAAMEAGNSLRQAALEQGWRTHDEGWHLRAGDDLGKPRPNSGTAAPPLDEPVSTRPQTVPTRPDEPVLQGQSTGGEFFGLQNQSTAAGAAYPRQQHTDTQPQHGELEQDAAGNDRDPEAVERRRKEEEALQPQAPKPAEEDEKDDEEKKPKSKK
jgi:hypothetical protein